MTSLACKLLSLLVSAGLLRRRAACRYSVYSPVQKYVFHPTGAIHCTDKCEMWQTVYMSFINAEMQDSQNCQNLEFCPQICP